MIWQVWSVFRAVHLTFKESTMSEVQNFIDETVKEHPVVLFMKGTAQMPQCGFSARAVQILRAVGLKEVVTINVLEDDEVREGIKVYSNWPTIPQLYIKAEFVGGSDIMAEMFESGEMEKMLRDEKILTEE